MKIVSKSLDLVSVGLMKAINVRAPTRTPTLTPDKIDKLIELMRPGDIVIKVKNDHPGLQVAGRIGIGMNYTHAALYEGNGQFIHANEEGVNRKKVVDELTGPVKLAIIRPKYETEADLQAVLDYARDQLGKPYDSMLNTGDDSAIYCSELVSRALEAMPHPQVVEKRKFLGRELVAPDDILKLPGAEIVYDDNVSYLKNAASRWPNTVACAAGAVVGAPLGPVGSGVGVLAARMAGAAVANRRAEHEHQMLESFEDGPKKKLPSLEVFEEGSTRRSPTLEVFEEGATRKKA